jgi:hypothetical protein
MTVLQRAEILLVLAVAAGFSGLAGLTLRAGPPLHHPVETMRLLRALDADGSGALEPAELEGRDPPGQSWHTHDQNGDQTIDARELEIAMDELDPRWLLRMP